METGLAEALAGLGLAEVAAWTAALDEAAYTASRDAFPIVLDGDHSLSAGTVAGMSCRAAAEGRELRVVWLARVPRLCSTAAR